MTDQVGIFLVVLFVGIALTLVVGQILMRSGEPFLQDVFEKRETATSVARLLTVLFHLIVLGVIALVTTIDLTLEEPVQTVVARLGLVLLVLGVAYAIALVVLARLRARRRMQMLLDERAAQAEQARAQQYGGSDASAIHPGTQATYPGIPRTYPAREPGSRQ